jgi:hypothetical protein
VAEDLVYMYTNLRLMAEGKEKDEKKWYIDNVDIEDLDFALKEDVKVHGDLDLEGWDDGNLGIQNSDGKTNCSLLASSKNLVRNLEDEYTFRYNGDDHLKDLPSIAVYVNGHGLLNRDNILRKCSTIEDVEDVVTTKANNVGEIDIKKRSYHLEYLQRRNM